MAPSAGFGISFSVKNLFFDRPHVERSMDAATHKAMRTAAGAIRLTAQRSMRYVQDRSPKTSAPGQPPRARRPHPWLRKNLWFYYDPGRKTAVIGPVRLPIAGDAPHVLEFGGRLHKKNKHRRVRRLGGGGEIRITRVTKNPVKGVDVFYARLPTQAMVDRSNQLNALLYGPAMIDKPLEARPFMGRALRETPIAPLWRDSVRVKGA